jgi:hypothetical protein
LCNMFALENRLGVFSPFFRPNQHGNPLAERLLDF